MPEPQVAPERISSLADLQNLPPSTIQDLLWNRLTRSPETSFPPLGRDEDPGDFFIRLVSSEPGHAAAKKIQEACCRQLASEAIGEIGDTSAIAELCYVAAMTHAERALAPMARLLSRADLKGRTCFLGPLDQAILRSFGALLIRFRVHGDEHRSLLTEMLKRNGCEIPALTTLVCLWPERRGEFIGLLHADFRFDERLLEVSVKAQSGLS